MLQCTCSKIGNVPNFVQKIFRTFSRDSNIEFLAVQHERAPRCFNYKRENEETDDRQPQMFQNMGDFFERTRCKQMRM